MMHHLPAGDVLYVGFLDRGDRRTVAYARTHLSDAGHCWVYVFVPGLR